MISKLSKILLITLSLLIFVSCAKKKEEIIPNTYVNFTIRLDDPMFTNLHAIGNSVIITSEYAGRSSAGYDYNGIIVYRFSEDEFYAFDRTCPYNISNSISVTTENTSDPIAKCPECGSEYVLPSLAFPTEKGPSRVPLKQYNTNFDGVTISVYN
ncbi:MAG: hypothetical protein J7K53_14175 [Bacteroidales bacterium]|nr:hypothetical protein [Bacteroidales bacterium]